MYRRFELFGGVSSGLIEKDGGMSVKGGRVGDFLAKGPHGVGLGLGHDDRGALGLGRDHSADQVGALVALALGLPGPASLARPLAHEAVLLAEVHLVMEPDLDRRGLRQKA